MNKIRGIVTPLITPLNNDESLDVIGLSKIIEHQVASGISGIFILGTTGEGPALSFDLQREMIVQSSKIIAGRIPLMVGVSSPSLTNSVYLGKYAKQHGADAVVSTPPFYLPVGQEELPDYYGILAKRISLPVYAYNIPLITNTCITEKTAKEILKVSGVVGYKDSSGNMGAFSSIINDIQNLNCSLFMGPDTLMGSAVLMGADGGVNSGANIFPELFVSCYNAALVGNIAMVKQYQKCIHILQDVYRGQQNICNGVVAGIKFILEHRGLCSSKTVLPLSSLNDVNISTLVEVSQKINLAIKAIANHPIQSTLC